MRAIKFRAWHKQERKMYHWGSGVIALDHQLNVQSVPSGRILQAEHIVLMQFTGLKDTSGVEIYEGDIVKVSVDQEPYGTGGTFTGVIAYDVKRWTYRLTGEHRQFNLAYADEIEVIGNIYEHPQLEQEE